MLRILPAEPFVAEAIAWRIHRERVLLAGRGRPRCLHRLLTSRLALTFGEAAWEL